jgi:hypothetical protein
MKTLIGLFLVVCLTACATGQQIQKKCKQVEGQADTFVCEQP